MVEAVVEVVVDDVVEVVVEEVDVLVDEEELVEDEVVVGKLAFAGDGALLWSEKSNTSAECAVQVWHNQTVETVGSHRGSITGLSVMNELAFTAGRDGDLACWNWRTGQRQASRKLSFWPRVMLAHPSEARLALLHDSLVMLALPDLQVQANTAPSPAEGGMASAACFAGPEQHLVVGRHTGALLRYAAAGSAYTLESMPGMSAMPGGEAVRGLAYSTPYQTLIVGAGNEVRFYAWGADGAEKAAAAPERPAGRLAVGPAKLAAVQLSPSGEFLAVGKVDGSAELWDLRVLGLPGLFQKPLSRGTPNDLAAIQALRARRPAGMEQPAGVEQPAEFRVDLEIIYLLLFKRLMHDIQLGEAPHIQPGDFDIILSG